MIGTIIVSGAIAQKPWQGGHTWAFLQYVLGLRKLGWDVLLVDQLEPDMCLDSDGQPCGIDESVNLDYFLRVMEGFQLTGAWSLLSDKGRRSIGVSRAALLERSREAVMLLNVMGYLRDAEILEQVETRVFLDIDPGFGQMWHELGLHVVFTGHDHYVTIGENIQGPECEIPTCGREWITTSQPVVLDYWPAVPGSPTGPMTTVASWRGTYGPVPFRGKTYGLRVHEFRKFLALPALSGEEFELALDIHSADARDRAALAEHGWSLVDPRGAAGDPWLYQSYVQKSKGEFMVAKNMYVQTRSGWLSDRSICYLASGRPVVAQDTGLECLYPVGQGLVTFRSIEEAAEAVSVVSGNYETHARAARALAIDYFDSDKVLSRLLQKVGVA